MENPKMILELMRQHWLGLLELLLEDYKNGNMTEQVFKSRTDDCLDEILKIDKKLSEIKK